MMTTDAPRKTACIARLSRAPAVGIVALSSLGLWAIILVAVKILAHYF